MSRFSLTVNGESHTVDADPDCPLLYVLRDTLALDNPRFGCGLGQCGACTVIIDHHAVRSCRIPVSNVGRREVTTLEGLSTARTARPRTERSEPDRERSEVSRGSGQSPDEVAKPHPVQQAFIDEQAFQCGYCLNGWVMTAKALLDSNPHPSDDEIRRACQGLICRCGSHVGILAAVRRAAGLARA